MTITTGSFAKDLQEGVESWYGLKYKETPVQHLDVFSKKKSKKAFEEVVGATGFGLAPVKTEGDSISFEDTEQGFIDRFTHITYALGFIITREMHEDGLAVTESLRRAEALAFSIRQTIETVAANKLNRAFNSSYVYGDGVELCSELHPNKSGGTWKNEPSTAADLSETSLEQAMLDIGDFATDKGLNIAVRARKLILPFALQFEAERILKSIQRVSTANNDINAIKSSGVLPEGFCINDYLTDADAWFIKTDCPNGLTHFERRAMEFGADDDWDTENAKFKSTFRGSWGCPDKRGIYGSPGAA